MLGFIIDRFKSLYVMFFAFGFFMGFLILVLYLTPLGDFKIDHHDELVTDNIDLDQLGHTSNETLTQIEDTNVMVTEPTSFMEAIFKLITKPRLLLFLFDLKADVTLLGLSSFVGVTLEILVFYFGKYILESTFPETIIIAGGLISTLRASLYAFFGTTSLEIISQLSPPRLRATALGILAATENLSTGLGQIVGGLLYGHFGAVNMFLYSSWIGILAVIIYIVGLSMQKRRFY
ncbi:20316_t:CDS:2 [Dentiscutata erythropus]|uniref:20316_t:CDS:1 n=1 Tax=Dentiscutata erythropus TaxID=1348616 RepID=A0A9N9JKN1_9GLOM|nr:20316_t:CDS:2 [Dentiscutata erythropus]